MPDVNPLAACMDFLETYWKPESLQRISSPPEESWIWSDLHLSDWEGLKRFRRCFQRGFVAPKEMNHFILKQWCDRVAADETIICLGDVVSRDDTLADEALVAAIRSCPGQRVLVAGNHDNPEVLRKAGFMEYCWGAVCETDPLLVLTHDPRTLEKIPPNTVNVHGHVHIHEDTEMPASDRSVKGMWRSWTKHPRRINVVVELTDYAPVRLSDVVTVARERLGRG